jgi:hypothetical protein
MKMSFLCLDSSVSSPFLEDMDVSEMNGCFTAMGGCEPGTGILTCLRDSAPVFTSPDNVFN